MAERDVVNETHSSSVGPALPWGEVMGVRTLSTVIDAIDVALGQRIEGIVMWAMTFVATPVARSTGFTLSTFSRSINVLKRAEEYVEEISARDTAWGVGYTRPSGVARLAKHPGLNAIQHEGFVVLRHRRRAIGVDRPGWGAMKRCGGCGSRM